MRIRVRHTGDDPEHEPQVYDVTELELDSGRFKVTIGDYGNVVIENAESDEES